MSSALIRGSEGTGRAREKKIENENCTILIPEGNSYCRLKSSARGPRFKVLSERLSIEIDILIRSPIQVLTEINAEAKCNRWFTVAVCH